MRFVKRIRCKLFPVGPDFLQHLRVMSVLLSTFNELRLHVIQLVTQLLTHGLTQGIRFTTRKVGQQARQQHHLLLIHCNTIRILQVFLHNRDIVLNRLPAVFTVDEVRNVVHRSRRSWQSNPQTYWAEAHAGTSAYPPIQTGTFRWFVLHCTSGK